MLLWFIFGRFVSTISDTWYHYLVLVDGDYVVMFLYRHNIDDFGFKCVRIVMRENLSLQWFICLNAFYH